MVSMHPGLPGPALRLALALHLALGLAAGVVGAGHEVLGGEVLLLVATPGHVQGGGGGGGLHGQVPLQPLARLLAGPPQVVVRHVGDENVGHGLAVVHGVDFHVDVRGGGGDGAELVLGPGVAVGGRVDGNDVRLLAVGEGGAVDGGVGPDGGDHQRAQHLALAVEEVLAVGAGRLVGGGGGDGGGGGGGGEVGIVAGGACVPRLQARHRRRPAPQGTLGEPAEDDEGG